MCIMPHEWIYLSTMVWPLLFGCQGSQLENPRRRLIATDCMRLGVRKETWQAWV
jgi:hypothetical protein